MREYFTLQKIIDGRERLLYFRERTKDKEDPADCLVTVPAGEKLSLETYFNSFSLGKWAEYTMVENVSFRMVARGDLRVRLFYAEGESPKKYAYQNASEEINYEEFETHHYGVKANVVITTLEEGENPKKEYRIFIPMDAGEGIMFPVIKAGSRDAVIYEAAYETCASWFSEEEDVRGENAADVCGKDETDAYPGEDDLVETTPCGHTLNPHPMAMPNPVHLALGICTYQREEQLRRNVNAIREHILENPQSPLKDRLEIFISDNGQTLEEAEFHSDKIHVFSNKNYGGSGGFTRTMMEALYPEGEDVGKLHPGENVGELHFEDDAWPGDAEIEEGKSEFTHMILMDDDVIIDPRVLERLYLFLRWVHPEYEECSLSGALFNPKKPYLQFESGGFFDGITLEQRHNHWDMRRREAVICNGQQEQMNYGAWCLQVIPAAVIHRDNLPLPLFIHYDDVEYGVRNENGAILSLNGICVCHEEPADRGSAAMDYYNVRNILIAISSLAEEDYTVRVKRMIFMRCFGALCRKQYGRAFAVLKGAGDFLAGPEEFLAQDPLERHSLVQRFNGLEYESKGCVKCVREYLKLMAGFSGKYKRADKTWKEKLPELKSLEFWEGYLD